MSVKAIALPDVLPGTGPWALRDRVVRNPWLLPWLAAGSADRWFRANLLVAAAYALLGIVVGRFFGAYGLFPAPIWLPAGLACVAAMTGGRRLLPGIFAGSFAVNFWDFGSPFGTTLLISLANALGPYAGCLVARAFRPSTGLFTRFIGVLGFILGCVVVQALASAGGGTVALALGTAMDAQQAYVVFARWWLSDAGGVLFFAPALLLWLGAEATPGIQGHRPRRLDVAVLVATAGFAIALFGVPGLGRLVRPDVVFLLTVPLSWVTLRISLRAAYTLLTAICVIATVGTVVGEGPFHAPTVANALQSVGLMVVLFAGDALTLVALVSERREAEARLAASNDRLEREVAARTADLRRRAETDSLTGMGNRRYLIERAGTLLHQARQAGRPFSLILFDIDHFKAVNDSHGHAMGDAALRLVADLCARVARSEDVLGRMGGEEFALVLPNTTLPEAQAVAERLRAAIARRGLPLSAPGQVLHLTASFGVAEWDAGDKGGLDELLRRADAAVYAAKAAGRNRVMVAET
jgi:diguanylate cyclase (GGDEF)-like protein